MAAITLPAPSLRYYLGDKGLSFYHPLDEPIQYVEGASVWVSPTTGEVMVTVIGQWVTRGAARSRQTRRVLVRLDDDSNPEWLRDLIKDAQRRLK